MKVLAIVQVGVTRFLRDRSNVLSMLLLPMAFVFLIGLQFGGESRPTVAVSGPEPVARQLVERLEAGGAVEARLVADADLHDEVASGAAAIGVSLSEASGQQLESGLDIEVGVLTRPEGTGTDLLPLVSEALTETAMAPTLAAMLSARADLAPAEVTAAVEAAMAAAAPVTVEMVWPGGEEAQATGGRFAGGAAQQLTLMVFLFALFGATSLVQNRQMGLSHRMLSTPTRMWTVVVGEAGTGWAIGMLQGVYIMGASALLFSVAWGNLAAAALVLAAFGAVGAGLGMLIGTRVNDEGVIVGVALVVGLSVAALGGAMLPSELFTSTMQTVSQFTPHAWALDALDAIRNGGGIADVWQEVAVLAGASVVLFTLAAWQLRIVLSRS